ncbi:MAG: cellulose synthase subunit BcsC-related outer membrane protein, partial [Campylobacterota bacterium]|nr:cellulose synthase subunit BcsC-related outer membrane protein [Campylobacterota bacterium]
RRIDLIIAQVSQASQEGDYEKAKNILKDNETKYPSLKKRHIDILIAQASQAAQDGDYEKAKNILKDQKSSKVDKARFETDYVHALALRKEDKDVEAIRLMLPYLNIKTKADRFIEEIALKRAGDYLKRKDYDMAKQLLKPFLSSSQHSKKLYSQISIQERLDLAWSTLEEDPKKSLSLFETSCALQRSNICLEGIMYASYNLHYFSKSSSIAQELYFHTKDQKAVKVALQSAIKMNDFKRASFWYNKLIEKDPAFDPNKIAAMLQVESAIKAQEYHNALQMVSYLSALHPNDSDVLQKKIEVLLYLKAYDDVEENLTLLMKIDPLNRYAFSIKASLLSRQHECHKALVYFEKLETLEAYELNPYLECSARVAIDEHNYNRAAVMIESLDTNQTKSGLYTLMAQSYESHHNRDALRAYKKALFYDSENFDLMALYLYRLKDAEDDANFESTMQYAKEHFHENKNLEVLQTIENEYEQSRLNSYYKNERFGLCYRYGSIVLEGKNDHGLERMHAWCAYYIKEYEQAEKLFGTLNLKYGQNVEDTYAFALSAYANNDHIIAIDALTRIEDQLDEEQRLKVAQLYMNLDAQNRAKAILKDMPENRERKRLLRAINKSNHYTKTTDNVSAGLHYIRRSGTEGLHWFEQYILPVDVNLYSDPSIHWYLHSDVLYLYDGFLADSNGTYLDFGLGETNQRDDISSDIGFMPKIGMQTSFLDLEVGATPLGAKITPELTWLISLHGGVENWGAHIDFSQSSIDESMLSFVGERSSKDNLEVNWGRVLKRGFKAGISYDSEVTLNFDIDYNPWIHGLNVMDNSEFKGVASAMYHSSIESLSYANFGVLFVYNSYEKNSDLFTYGHGGYFSPQDFWLGSFVADIGDTYDSRYYWKAKGSVGFEGYIVEDAQKYPLGDINDDALSGTVDGYSSGGLTYKVALGVGFRATDSIDFILSGAFEKIYNYEKMELGFAMVYFFNEDHKGSLRNFHASHRIETTLE